MKLKGEGMTISFPYDKEKAENAVLWFLHKHGRALNVLKLMKLMFYADREHLVRYGRPITGGSYCAMPKGPVASELYDSINDSVRSDNYPFRLDENGYTVHARADTHEDCLSESDIEILEKINNKLGGLDQFTLKDMTHELEVWTKNFEEASPIKFFPLPYEDFFADFDDESAKRMLDIIKDESKAWSILE